MSNGVDTMPGLAAALTWRCPTRERSATCRKRTIRTYYVRTRTDDCPDGSRKSPFPTHANREGWPERRTYRARAALTASNGAQNVG
jgi:hypothetical protein